MLGACGSPAPSAGPHLVEGANAESAELAAAWAARLTGGAQEDALADGRITLDEYLAALNAGRACMKDATFETSAIRITFDGIRRDFTVTQTTQSEDEMDQAWARCRYDNYGAAETVWLLQHKRFDVDGAALLAELRDCATSNGIASLPPDASAGQVSQELSRQHGSLAARTCFERYMIYAGKDVVRPH
jgi:hypothetical protein